jgi:protein-S-isoprenylcysteine O-methyltransferase Ste14
VLSLRVFPAPIAFPTRDAGELVSRVVVGTLFLMLAQRLALDYLTTGHVTGLLLLTSETLVVILTIIRKPAIAVDRSWQARSITCGALAGPLLLRTVSTSPVADAWSAAISAAGLFVIISGKLSLGRSFGLMPANRGIVCSGLYKVVRHPIYAGYLVAHLGFALAHLSWWNIVVLVVADTALLVRAGYEERTLSQDPEYAAYRERVRWRIVPWVF